MKRRTWLTLGAVVIGGAGAAAYAEAGPADGPGGSGTTAERPVSVRQVALPAAGPDRREVTRTGTGVFSLLGVAWDGDGGLDGTAQVRTRSTTTGEWSHWRTLGTAERTGGRASAPLWVGPSDGVRARVVADDGSSSAGLPEGLELTLVDPGVTAAEAQAGAPAAVPPSADGTDATGGADGAGDTGRPDRADGKRGADGTAGAAPVAFAAAPAADPVPPSPRPSTVKRPVMVSRAGWGAAEQTVTKTPEYNDGIGAVFVHHTGDSNAYSCAQSASLVRAVMAYDVEAGLGDLGYNFLVDKCGRVFEGRAGGADQPVRGAHTPGFDHASTGIAVLGDFDGSARPTRAALESVARVAAWKLGQYGGSPTGRVTLTAYEDSGVYAQDAPAELDVISGGRDAAAPTTSPGANLYSRLDEIRRYAASAGRNAVAPTADYNGDGVADLVAPTPGAGSGWITLVPGGATAPVSSARLRLNQAAPGVPGAAESGDQWGAATGWGDIDGDGYADLAIGAPGEDDTTGHKDRGAVTILYGPRFDSDADTMALGDDFEYTGARFGSAIAVGDFNADGKADVFAAATGTGGNWAARFGDGHEVAGDLTTATKALAHTDATSGDFNRDGLADVALTYRDAAGTGRITWFKGSRTLGLTKAGTLSVKGGRAVAAGDINGDGYDDVVVGQPDRNESGADKGGQVTVIPGSTSGLTTTGTRTVHQATAGVEGASEAGDAFGSSVSVGDLDGDGFADVLTGAPAEDITRASVNRADAGAVWVLKGTAAGLTGTGSRTFNQDSADIPGATEKGDRFGSAVVLADLTGDGYADLVVGTEGEDADNGTLLWIPAPNGTPTATRSSYYGVNQLGTATAGRLGQVLTP